MTLRGDLLAEADRITHGARQEDYGDPVQNMADIAAIFNAATGHNILPHQVPIFHICTKLARMKRSPAHRDSAVDVMNYSGIAHECAVAAAAVAKVTNDDPAA